MAANSLSKTVEEMDLDELEVDLRASRAMTTLLEAAIAVRRGGSGPPGARPDLVRDSGSASTDLKPPSKRKAVLRLLGERPAEMMKQSAIRDELVRRGWLDDTPRATHSLAVTISKTTQRGDLERPKPAHYRITPQGMVVDTTF